MHAQGTTQFACKRVAFDGVSRAVIDGLFAETGELVAGYSLWQVKDMEEAVAWVKRCPNPMPGSSEIEIRPVFEMADFGACPKPPRLGRVLPNPHRLTARRL